MFGVVESDEEVSQKDIDRDYRNPERYSGCKTNLTIVRSWIK